MSGARRAIAGAVDSMIDSERLPMPHPKVELHVHLEGAIHPETALELARRNGVRLPFDDAESLRRWFRFESFDKFIEVYLAVTGCLRTAADYELIVVEFARDAMRQNLRHAEVTFSPATHAYFFGVAPETFLEGLRVGRARAAREFGLDILWVFDIVRNSPEPARDAEFTLETLRAARGDGAVALGLGGKEPGFPCEPFEPWFRRALEDGFRSVPHAGELCGPESVRAAVERLGAHRIGHGVRAADDPALLGELARRGVHLEVCPTSNVRLGVARSLEEHPLPRILAAGVPVSVNSDDPALFNVSLTEELEHLEEAMGLPPGTRERLTLAALDASFLPPERKAALRAEFEREFAAAR